MKLFSYKSVFILITLILIVRCGLGQNQIRINQQITSNLTLTPFNSINSLYGLTVNGSVSLNSDVSYVRILLKDSHGMQYLVYEYYKLLSGPSLAQSIRDVGDETYYTQEITPSEISIEVNDANITIDNFEYKTHLENNQNSLIQEHNDEIVQAKIELINQNTKQLGLLWRAGQNTVCSKTYEEKKSLSESGEASFMYGFDYYYSGIFEFPPYQITSTFTDNLVPNFDWRAPHGAEQNIPSSPYFNSVLQGWIPPRSESQGNCGTCKYFAYTYATEAYTNLFLNKPLNVSLSVNNLRNCIWNTYYSNVNITPENNPCKSNYWTYIHSYIPSYINIYGIPDESLITVDEDYYICDQTTVL